jgi:hypothetical protein
MAVCPEPVLVKRSFLYINGMAIYIYIYIHAFSAPSPTWSRAAARSATQRPGARADNTTTQQHKTNFSSNYPNVCPEPVLAMNRRRYFGSKGNVQRSALRFGDISRVNDDFETRRGSNFRPFSFGSSRFNVQMSAQKAATTQFERFVSFSAGFSWSDWILSPGFPDNAGALCGHIHYERLPVHG